VYKCAINPITNLNPVCSHTQLHDNINTKRLKAVKKSWSFFFVFICDTHMEGLLLIYTDMQSQFNFINTCINFVFLRQYLWQSKSAEYEKILQLKKCILLKYKVTYHLFPSLKQKPFLHMQESLLLLFLSHQSRYYYHVNQRSIFQWTSSPFLPCTSPRVEYWHWWRERR
jgi:hypothetical protein